MSQTLGVGELGKAVGVAPSAIRFYEHAGVLSEPARTESGYRRYASEDAERLTFVVALRHLGIPLRDIREIVALRDEGTAPCGRVRASLIDTSRAIESRISTLRATSRELGKLRAVAEALPDDWPQACVCNAVVETKSAEDER